MANIIIPGTEKNDKDCKDWCPLQDGTKTGDPKYCDLSLECRQIGMRSDWVWYKHPETGELERDYFCTGFYASIDDRGVDKEIS